MQQAAPSNDKHCLGVSNVLVPQEREQYGKLVELSKAQGAHNALQVLPWSDLQAFITNVLNTYAFLPCW